MTELNQTQGYRLYTGLYDPIFSIFTSRIVYVPIIHCGTSFAGDGRRARLNNITYSIVYKNLPRINNKSEYFAGTFGRETSENVLNKKKRFSTNYNTIITFTRIGDDVTF